MHHCGVPSPTDKAGDKIRIAAVETIAFGKFVIDTILPQETPSMSMDACKKSFHLEERLRQYHCFDPAKLSNHVQFVGHFGFFISFPTLAPSPGH